MAAREGSLRCERVMRLSIKDVRLAKGDAQFTRKCVLMKLTTQIYLVTACRGLLVSRECKLQQAERRLERALYSLLKGGARDSEECNTITRNGYSRGLRSKRRRIICGSSREVCMTLPVAKRLAKPRKRREARGV
jgi:hypothetical protein